LGLPLALIVRRAYRLDLVRVRFAPSLVVLHTLCVAEQRSIDLGLRVHLRRFHVGLLSSFTFCCFTLHRKIRPLHHPPGPGGPLENVTRLYTPKFSTSGVLWALALWAHMSG